MESSIADSGVPLAGSWQKPLGRQLAKYTGPKAPGGLPLAGCWGASGWLQCRQPLCHQLGGGSCLPPSAGKNACKIHRALIRQAGCPWLAAPAVCRQG